MNDEFEDCKDAAEGSLWVRPGVSFRCLRILGQITKPLGLEIKCLTCVRNALVEVILQDFILGGEDHRESVVTASDEGLYDVADLFSVAVGDYG